MKRYLIKIFEKMQHEQAGRDSPLLDPLMEHSNSVQESSMQKGAGGQTQSSLSDISSNFSTGPGRQGTSNNVVVTNKNAANVAMARKLQFYTSNNFYPGGKQPIKNKYENTDNYIKEESSGEENQMQTEDERDGARNKKVVSQDEEDVYESASHSQSINNN